MSHFEYALHMLERYIEFYFSNPCDSTRMQLLQGITKLFMYYKLEQRELEERITNNVLQKLSVKADTKEAISEIHSLKKAMDELLK